LSTIRQFAIYLAGSGLPVGVPAVRQGVSGSRRATPYLYSAQDIQALMATARQLFTPLRAATMTTLIGLLAVTGMRIGEAVRLTVGDADLDQGVILIAHAKFGRQRMVRLDPTSCDALAGYLSVPVRHRLGVGPEGAVFVTQKGTAAASTPLKARSTRWSSTLACRFEPALVRVCTIFAIHSRPRP
jgi:integrase